MNKTDYNGNYGDKLKKEIIPSLIMLIRKKYIKGQVLEAGSAHGQNLPEFEHCTGQRPHALDINQKMCLETAEAGYPCITHDLDKPIPLQTEYYDTIYCNQVLEHVESPYNVLKEFHRLLKNNGKLIIGVPNARYDKATKDCLHVSFFTPLTLKQTLISAGFTPLNIISDIPKPLKFMPDFCWYFTYPFTPRFFIISVKT